MPRVTPPLLVESLDFAPLGDAGNGINWNYAAQMLSESARRLEQAGAQGLLICANSMHRVYDAVAEGVSIPVIHAADCIGARMARDGVSGAALMGRRNVMTESFFRERLVNRGVDLLAPEMADVEEIDRIIHEELMRGKASRNAERALRTIFTQKEQAGAKAIVLACTELELVVDIDANVLPIFDSAHIHCQAAVAWMKGADAVV